jgi:hypothetical protein
MKTIAAIQHAFAILCAIVALLPSMYLILSIFFTPTALLFIIPGVVAWWIGLKLTGGYRRIAAGSISSAATIQIWLGSLAFNGVAFVLGVAMGASASLTPLWYWLALLPALVGVVLAGIALVIAHMPDRLESHP